MIISELQVSLQWQAEIARWLARSGCLYAMAWGVDASSWDDALDIANLEGFRGEIPEHRFVMTTWHDHESLVEVFSFCKTCAFHPAVELKHTLLLHIATADRRQELMALYAQELM